MYIFSKISSSFRTLTAYRIYAAVGLVGIASMGILSNVNLQQQEKLDQELNTASREVLKAAQTYNKGTTKDKTAETAAEEFNEQNPGITATASSSGAFVVITVEKNGERKVLSDAGTDSKIITGSSESKQKQLDEKKEQRLQELRERYGNRDD